MFKKISLFLVLIVFIGVVVPYIFGFLAEKSYRGIIDTRIAVIKKQMNSDRINLKVEITDYNRGWFSSSAKLKSTASFKAKDTDNAMYKSFGGFMVINDEEEVRIYHGPVLFANFMGSKEKIHLGKAFIQGKATFSTPVANLVFGKETSLDMDLRAKVSFSDQVDQRIELKANQYNVRTAQINLGKIFTQYLFPISDLSNFKNNSTFFLDKVEVKDDTAKLKFDLHKLKVVDDSVYRNNNIANEKTDFNIAKVSFQEADAGNMVSVDNISNATTLDVNKSNNLYDIKNLLNIGKVTVNLPGLEMSSTNVISDFSVKLDFDNIDFIKLQDLHKYASSFGYRKEPLKEEEIAKIWNLLSGSFVKDSSAGLNIHTKSYKGDLKFNLSLNFAHPWPSDYRDVKVISNVVKDIKIDVVADKELIRLAFKQSMTYFARNTQLNKAKIDIDRYKEPFSKEQIGATVQQWEDAGLIEKEGDNYKFSISLSESGVPLINGYDFSEHAQKLKGKEESTGASEIKEKPLYDQQIEPVVNE